jgi:hypothetical protein
MIFVLLKVISYLSLSMLICLALKDLSCYIYWLQNYKKYGIPFIYFPVFGTVYFLAAPLQELFEGKKSFDAYKIGYITGSDPMSKMRKIYDQYKENDIIAINQGFYNVMLVIKANELITELANRENDIGKR